jgi:Serine hydrolase
MKHLIILPGNSARNKKWGERVVAHYGEYFNSLFMLAYEHWETGANTINFQLEEDRLRQHVATLPPGTEIYIFAKSAGSILTLLAVHSGVVTPVQCVLFGMPLDMATKDIFAGSTVVIEAFKVPTIIFHNEHDPITSCSFAKKLAAQYLPQATFVTTTGNNHNYDEHNVYRPHLNWLTSIEA